MYSVHQFKPALYLVVLLGISGYALAALAPALWVFAVLLILTHVWLSRQGTWRPIPRWLANGITILAFLYAALQVRGREVESPILAVGQFLVLLQVVKVWEQRANRDYAQLLVLSLLLMVAAAISTASLLFGGIFIAYLIVSLYCCLLFHLKIESETAAEASVTTAILPPTQTPADQRRALSASIRRVTGLIAAYALVSAVAVFLFFPGGPGPDCSGSTCGGRGTR